MGFADLIDGADIRVIKSGGGTGLTMEALQDTLVVSYQFWQKLQGYKAAQFGVLGLIDHTHAAAAEGLDDAVVGEGATDNPKAKLLSVFLNLISPGIASKMQCRYAINREIADYR